MKTGYAVAVIVGAIAFAPCTRAEQSFQMLSSDQIRARFAGAELTDEVHWRDRYERGGAVTSHSMGSTRAGRWLVEKGRLCVEFEKETSVTCYEVWMAGRNVELRREGALPVEGVLQGSIGRK